MPRSVSREESRRKVARAHKLRELGATFEEIAADLHVTKQCVSQYLAGTNQNTRIYKGRRVRAALRRTRCIGTPLKATPPLVARPHRNMSLVIYDDVPKAELNLERRRDPGRLSDSVRYYSRGSGCGNSSAMCVGYY